MYIKVIPKPNVITNTLQIIPTLRISVHNIRYVITIKGPVSLYVLKLMAFIYNLPDVNLFLSNHILFKIIIWWSNKFYKIFIYWFFSLMRWHKMYQHIKYHDIWPGITCNIRLYTVYRKIGQSNINDDNVGCMENHGNINVCQSKIVYSF